MKKILTSSLRQYIRFPFSTIINNIEKTKLLNKLNTCIPKMDEKKLYYKENKRVDNIDPKFNDNIEVKNFKNWIKNEIDRALNRERGDIIYIPTLLDLLIGRRYYFYNRGSDGNFYWKPVDENQELKNSIKKFIDFLYNEKNRGEDDSFLKFRIEILLFNCKDKNDRKQIYEYYVEDDILPKEREYYCINDKKDSEKFKEAKEIVRNFKFPYGEYENYWYLFCNGLLQKGSHEKTVEKIKFDEKNLSVF